MKHLIFCLCAASLTVACSGGGGGGSDETVTGSPNATDSPSVVASSSPPPISPGTPTSTSTVESSQAALATFSLTSSQARQALSDDAIVVSNASRSRDIEVPNDFNLQSNKAVTLSVTIDAEANLPAYLSVCTDYRQDDAGQYIINYESCLLRTSLDSSDFETDLTITNDMSGLVAALWFLNAQTAPVIQHWDLNTNRL